MALLWFLLGYGVAAWIAHQERQEEALKRIEHYANTITEDDK